MSESISRRINAAAMDKSEDRELRALMLSFLTDMTAIKASVNQLIADYNANATISTDTTAAAITLNTTA